MRGENRGVEETAGERTREERRHGKGSEFQFGPPFSQISGYATGCSNYSSRSIPYTVICDPLLSVIMLLLRMHC